MIPYNPKEWLRFLLRFPKSDTAVKLLPLGIVLALYSAGVAYYFIDVFHLEDRTHLRNMTLLHNLLGFAISMLLVFRTNTAYDRWWEGRKLWGQLVNSSRNLSLKLNAMLPASATAERAYFRQIIPCFAQELQKHLQHERTRYALDEQPHPEIPNFDHNGHVPLQVASSIMQRLQQLYSQKQITGDQLIVLNSEATALMDICGACERIKNTPIPYSYSAFIKKFIFIYILTLPIGYVFSLGYLIVPVVLFIFYVMASLELIAEEIEDPFGHDSNDLPMKRLAENIGKNVQEIIR